MKRFLRKARVAVRRSPVTKVAIEMCIAIAGIINFGMIVGDPVEGDVAWQNLSDTLTRVAGIAGLLLDVLLANWAYKEHLLPQHIYDEARLDEKEMKQLED